MLALILWAKALMCLDVWQFSIDRCEYLFADSGSIRPYLSSALVSKYILSP
jgi:hypothetical protein